MLVDASGVVGHCGAEIVDAFMGHWAFGEEPWAPYSTFNYETLQYLRGGAWAIGIANIFLTVAACLAAGVGGLALAQWWAGA